MPDSTGVTAHLEALAAGDRGAADRLAPLLYTELRALAASFFAREDPGHTLQPTVIANDAFVRLIGQNNADWRNRAHFMAVAATVMRRILVDHARHRAAAKRGGGEAAHRQVSLTGLLLPEQPASRNLDIEAVDLLITELASLNPRQGNVVVFRFFSGMSVEQCAAALGVSEKTIKNDWRFAKAWLLDRLSDSKTVGRSLPLATEDSA